MTKEIYISSTPHETRLAVVEDDQLAEIYYERENEYTLAGSIYKGKVTRVLPGMQSAFVDVGLERDAFLYITDFAEENEEGEEYVQLSSGAASSQAQQSASPASGRQAAKPEQGAQRASRPVSRNVSSATDQPSTEGFSNGSSGEASDPGESGNQASRRWRGRRGRRRGRGTPTGSSAHAESSHPDSSVAAVSNTENEEIEEGTSTDLDIASTEPNPQPFPPDRQEHSRPSPSSSTSAPSASAPFLLPGESLSKYRRGDASLPGTVPPNALPAISVGDAAHPPAPSTFKPSTMVEAPLAWDGSEVLPGESISRYQRPNSGKRAPSWDQSSPAAEVEPATSEPTAAENRGADQHPQSSGTAAVPAGEEITGAAASHFTNAEEFEPSSPEEGSASYRIDPSAPSAYRHSNAAEAEPGEEIETAQEPAISQVSQAEQTPEPFFDAAVPVVTPAHPAEKSVDPTQDIADPRAAEKGESEREPTKGTFDESPWPGNRQANEPPHQFWDTSSEKSKEVSGEDFGNDSADSEDSSDALDPEYAAGAHSFDPGQGVIEEEMIDGEEDEQLAANAAVDESEFDDLIEETLDTQMDSGLLSELVRDQHVDERTRFVEEHDAETETDEHFDEEDESLPYETADVEIEEASENGAAQGSAAVPARLPKRRGDHGQRQEHGRGRQRFRRASAQTTNLPAITELLKPNQEILVQIAKEPIARKGARITSHIALPGRFLVFMPTVNHVGVSRKISSDEERQRLKRILLSEKGDASGGFIVRTAASTASEEDLRADIRFLLSLWAEIRQRADDAKPPALIYHDLSLVERILRDQVTEHFSAIWVDSEADYERVLRFLQRFEPSLIRRVKLYTKETPLFEQFGIQEEINKALRSKVWLKSGGSIVINQTEALVAIDINTGKYVGKTARLEDTILKTNLDAIPEIVRQIRLRDLGGIIVIDFIDMDERKNRAKVMQALEEALRSDRAPSKVLQFNDFGLVAITRKRVKQSLERTLSVPCTICTGTGMVKGPTTVCNEIYIELRKMLRHLDRGDVMLRVHPEVVKQLKASNGRWLTEMEEMSRKTVIVKSDAALHPEQFDIH